MNRDHNAKPIITPSSGNVFIDVGLDESEAKLHKIRADLMVEIEKDQDGEEGPLRHSGEGQNPVKNDVRSTQHKF